MNNLFEYGDLLNRPYEIFHYDSNAKYLKFPVNPHWHYYTEIIYVLEGSMCAEVDGIEHRLSVGDLILFFPKSIHSITYTREDLVCNPLPSIKYIVVKVDSNALSLSNSYTPKISYILECAKKHPELPIVFNKEILKNLPIKQYLSFCADEMINQHYGYDIQVHSYLCIILTYLIRIWKKEGFNTDKSLVQAQNENPIYKITEYIDSHSHENIKIETLANMCNMSYSYFAKNFKTLYGKSCKEYIEFIRICKADNLLLFTDLTLSFISQEIGFTDCSHFIKTYKKLKGITPKQRRLSQH